MINKKYKYNYTSVSMRTNSVLYFRSLKYRWNNIVINIV